MTATDKRFSPPCTYADGAIHFRAMTRESSIFDDRPIKRQAGVERLESLAEGQWPYYALTGWSR